MSLRLLAGTELLHEIDAGQGHGAAAPSTPQATYLVTTLDDVVDASDGALSLREAIDLANGSPGGRHNLRR